MSDEARWEETARKIFIREEAALEREASAVERVLELEAVLRQIEEQASRECGMWIAPAMRSIRRMAREALRGDDE